MLGSTFRKVLAILLHLFNLLIIVVSVVYAAWFISDGKYPKFSNLYNHYTDLAQAFLKGQLALLKQPDPRLADLSNTHEAPDSGIPFIWDASYYKGKYYTYWGPVPAIPFMIWTAIKHEPAPDQIGVLADYVGIAVIFTVLLYLLRRQYFPRAPLFTIGIFTLAATLNPPYAMLLERPLTYETAILTGQFYLLLGFLFLFLYSMRRKPWMLVLSGLFMGFAILSRYDRVVTVLVYVAFLLLTFWLKQPEDGRPFFKRRQAWVSSALLLAPLAVCLAFALWYNYARFGNPLETGLTYQLTDPVPDNRYYAASFVPSNAYVYLFIANPILDHYPFVSIVKFKTADLPSWAPAAPGKQFDFGFFGLFHSTPIFWFGALSYFALAVLVIRRVRSGKQAIPDDRRPVARLIIILLAAGVLQMIFLLFYYYSAVRFLSDFYLPLLTAVILVCWELDRYLVDRPWLRAGYWAALVVLALQTVVIGFFAGFNLFPYYFSQHNKPLFEQIQALAAAFQDQIYAFLDPAGALMKWLKH